MGKRKLQAYKLKSETEIRVRFSEVDSMQIVWHGSYAKYFEDGREAFGLKYPGLGYMDVYKSGYAIPLVDMQIQYKRPLRYNETAIIETHYISTKAAKICFEYEIRRASDNVVVAIGSTTQVFLDNENLELQLISPEFYLNWKKQWDVK